MFPVSARRALRAFTLLELLLALAVAGVAVSLGLPPLSGLVADARRTVAVNALLGQIQFARGEAVRRNAPVVLCALRTDGGGCAPAGADWSAGWGLFLGDPARPTQLPPGADVIVRHEAHLPGGRISANRQAFVFQVDRRSTNGTFVVCDRRGAAHARSIIVSYTGRPRAAASTADGGALPCP